MRRARLTVVLMMTLVATSIFAPVSAVIEAEEAFFNTWVRTDQPVAGGQAQRTWLWGPQPNTTVLAEHYDEHPSGERPVQYWDKARMEVTDPNADSNSIWYVTHGLLVRELTSGKMQLGHNRFEDVGPATMNVAGDDSDPVGPTYQTIRQNIEQGTTFDDGQVINGVIDRNGINTTLPGETYAMLAAYGVTAGPYSPETGKHTASVFWEFMTSGGLVYENGTNVTAPLFENPYYATGLPIDQAWWANVQVAGTSKWLLLQCFERRCLTYTPDNPDGWQVEAANVGRHYYAWRYAGARVPPPPSVQGSVTIMAAGDIACDPESAGFNGGSGTYTECRQKYTADLILQHNPDAVFALGDLQYETGNLTDFIQSYERSWGQFKAKTYPVPGNHEYESLGASGYFDYFGGRAGDRDKGYYTVEMGAWQVLALNSNCSNIGGCGPGSPQHEWLRQTLEAGTGHCEIAFLHHPRWSSGKHGNHDQLSSLYGLLYDHGVEVVLTGHDHHYERFAPQDANGNRDDARGIRQFVVGTGGKNLYHLEQIVWNSEARNNQAYGVLQLELHADTYTWEFVPEAGQTFSDIGAGACR